ncbi:MAG: prephenate dehydrogenase/arogenate dehydrogenase family protein [Candidatus Gracilibacteria bacterium]|nr:prephenate dehydrogenase/arogenate dehydrogenase family protein [Candidatus Gracilibacteria bacterium]
MQTPTIAIIGGTSKFGQLWQRYFEGKGLRVIIASRSTEITPEQAVKEADIIIVSVSIRATVNTIENLVPHIPPGKLLLDFTGIKTEATQALLGYTTGEVVATHPMFGPWITSLQDQNIAFDPLRPGEKWNFLSHLWKADGANLIELPSRKHDELVAIVQSTVHIMNLMFGHLLAKRRIDIEELMKISTPNSRMQLCILARFLNQEAALYTDMQTENTVYRNEILPDIESYFHDLAELLRTGQGTDFENEFNLAKAHIGPDFLAKALKVSSEFDEHLKKNL